jgi:GT2 family glycosyltransferase
MSHLGNESPHPSRPPRIAVLMTCFNRRELTLRCLEAIFSQQAQEQRLIEVFLVDDASNDGTAAAVEEKFHAVHVIRGRGNLYWNGGMRVAFGTALNGNFDGFIWMNDDTILRSDAFDTLIGTSRELTAKGITAIVTASTCNAVTGKRTYGGILQQRGLITRSLLPVEPSRTEPLPCDTMNGNCTYIPRAVTDVLGNLEAGFTHSFGDLDYGFRARNAGFSVYIAPGFLGTCSDNSPKGTWRDQSTTWQKRWKQLNSVKGSPFKEWSLYCSRHQGPAWPLYAVSPYVKTLFFGILKSPTK